MDIGSAVIQKSVLLQHTEEEWISLPEIRSPNIRRVSVLLRREP